MGIVDYQRLMKYGFDMVLRKNNPKPLTFNLLNTY